MHNLLDTFTRKKAAICVLIFAAGLLVTQGTVRAQGQQQFKDREAQIKAVFVYKIIKYVGWPKGAFATPDSPIVIGVVGKHPISGHLQKIAKGRKLKKRSLEIKTGIDPGTAPGCHILFMPKDLDPATEKLILKAIDGKPVMTLGESTDFPAKKGVLAMVKENNKIKLYLSLAKARQQRLTISSQLAKLAKVVDPGAK